MPLFGDNHVLEVGGEISTAKDIDRLGKVVWVDVIVFLLSVRICVCSLRVISTVAACMWRWCGSSLHLFTLAEKEPCWRRLGRKLCIDVGELLSKLFGLNVFERVDGRFECCANILVKLVCK